MEYAIRDIITHAREYEKKNGKNVIYLNIGDPIQYDFPTPDHIKNALIKAVQNNETTILHLKDYQSLEAIVVKVKEKGFDIILSKNLSITLLVYNLFYHTRKMLRINKNILNFIDIQSKIYNATSITLSLFCVLGLLFVLVLGTDFADNKYYIVNTVWADEINGTENADSITGTINQDTIKGLQGNDTIGGRRGR